MAPHMTRAEAFLQTFYISENINFANTEEEIQKIANENKSGVIVLDLDYGEVKNGIHDPNGGKIIDLSEQYRAGKIDFTKSGNRPGEYFIISKK